EKQEAILDSSAPLVKPGGRLVYATCTLLKQENEDVIKSFLERHPEFKLIEPDKDNAVVGSIGYVNNTSYIRFFPHIHKTDGFFCAFLARNE
ncbi:MAG: hypothetical protein JXA06_05345, partial [Bacteroidetes bacterium]|nr:hypothetical protein [Bacteroidota bacterium]